MNQLELLTAYRCPRYEDFPAIPLYKDQVVSFLTQAVAPFYDGEQAPVTAAMINNYVKLRILPPPVKKRYNRTHLCHLIIICLLKQVVSISEIRALLAIQTQSYPFPKAYDYFCTELEKALWAAFSTRDFSAPSSASHVTPESELVRSAAMCFASKMFTVKFLELNERWKAER